MDKNGLDRDVNNINGIKGTKKKYPKRKITYKEHNDCIVYDQYGFNSRGLNKDGCDIYGFNKNRLNKDGLNKYGYKKTSGRIKTYKARSFKDQEGKEYVNLPILLSKMYANNNSKKLANDVEQLVKNLYDNKLITKEVYNILIKAITY